MHAGRLAHKVINIKYVNIIGKLAHSIQKGCRPLMYKHTIFQEVDSDIIYNIIILLNRGSIFLLLSLNIHSNLSVTSSCLFLS